MKTEHIQTEDVKKYLLGMLKDADASSIEERYFVDREFFLQMRRVEQKLVEDYLAGCLGWRSCLYFRRSYLRSPGLRQIVESAAAKRPPRPAGRPARRWAMGAGALVIVLAAIVYNGHRPSEPVRPPIATLPQRATIILQLYPDIRKDGSSRFPSLQLPSAIGVVRLIANLPRRTPGTPYLPQISLIQSSGSPTLIWNGSEQISTTDSHTEQVILSVSSSLFRTGDYFLELDTADRSTQYLCPFRILPNPPTYH